MLKHKANIIGGIFFSLLLIFSSLLTYGQKEIEASDKVVFIYFEQYEKNFILIPNFGKFYNFKIYRKLKSETDYKFITEKKRPAFPLKTNHPSPYSVNWQDPEFHSRDVDYKILAFDKNGNELCEMQITWEEEKGKSKKQIIENDSLKNH